MDERVFLTVCVLIVVGAGGLTDAVVSCLAWSPFLFCLYKNVRQLDAVGYVTWQT
jgi:hypothetical protein